MGRSYKTSYKQLHDLSDEIVLGAVGPFEESAGEEGFYVIMPEHFNGDGTLPAICGSTIPFFPVSRRTTS